MAVPREQDLDHDKAHSFEDDAAHLVEKARQAEGDLAEAGERDTKNDNHDVEPPLQRGVLNAPGPADEEDGDRGRRLEHLDEGDAEVQVHHVAAHQAGAVEQADGHNGAQVDAARHLDILAPIKECSRPRQDLGGQGREDEMPTC